MNKKIDRKLIAKIAIFIICVIAASLFAKNDYFLYTDNIATIDAVENVKTDTLTGTDGTHQYYEDYYTQKITATLRNGEFKGETVTLENQGTSSGVYDTMYQKGDDIFIDEVSSEGGAFVGKGVSAKRDYFFVLVLAIFIGLFLLIGGKEGTLTILSLGLNLVAFYFVMVLYNDGHNILFMTIPMVIFFTAMLLFFMYGRNEKTTLSFVSTIASVLITTGIAAIVMACSERVDYDFMDYLNQPYDQMDANFIFISEILVGTMGAVMDVVVTVIMTVNQIVETSPNIGTKDLIKSCRTVGDDLIGTMLPVIFFTNIAASIPFFVLSMRNGIAVLTILRHNVFFELARFLTGSIGIVLAIPISAAIAIWYYRRQAERRASKC